MKTFLSIPELTLFISFEVFFCLHEIMGCMFHLVTIIITSQVVLIGDYVDLSERKYE